MASHNTPRAATREPKTSKEREAELRDIAEYQFLVELIELKITKRQYTADVLQLTSKLLTKNPEYYTIWNVRRRLLTCGLFSKSLDSSSPSNPLPSTSPTDTTRTSAESYSYSTSTLSEASTATQADLNYQSPGRNGIILDLVQKDLDFLIPLLRKWPKCYWIWNYRIWLLQEATLRLEASVARRLWQEDMGLVGMMLVKDRRNIHGWRYRRIVVAQLESPALNGTSMVESEFLYTTKMITADLSNFSAWHNRSKLIPKLLDERDADDTARRKFLDNEFEIIKDALWSDSADQSPWFYYQFLMTTLIDPTAYKIIVRNFTRADRLEYLGQQIVDLKDLLEVTNTANDRRWIYKALIDYTAALWEIFDCQPPHEVKQDVKGWLTELRQLDPLRMGRWDDLEKSLCL